MTAADSLEATKPPSSATGRFRHVEVVINSAAGSVGPDAAVVVEQLLADRDVSHSIAAPEPDQLIATLKTAVDKHPDLLIVVAGDGTARAAATLCGANGSVLAPLAGGTMNMLPHALYGSQGWAEALGQILEQGEIAEVSGGEVDGRRFYVAAILGAPALWAEAREAVRHGELGVAWRKAHNAWRRAFASQLKFELDSGLAGKAEALSLICPLCSRAMDSQERALEADVLNPSGAAEAFRLGFQALLSEIGGDWRADPAVEVTRCRSGRAWASGHIPAILDGEPVRLHKQAEISFVPTAFRALVPPAALREPAP